MRAYPSTPAGSKPAVTAPVAPGPWSLAARLAITHWRNRRHRCGPRCAERTRALNARGRPGPHHRGPGIGRRAKLEYRLVAAQDWLRGLLRGARQHMAGVELDLARALALAEQLGAQLGRYAPSSARLRQLVALVQTTGPSSGWAFTEARTRGPKGPTCVRLYLPRRSDHQARQWRSLVNELRGLLWRVAQLASRLSPTLRASSTHSEERRCGRDHQSDGGRPAAWLEALRRRWGGPEEVR